MRSAGDRTISSRSSTSEVVTWIRDLALTGTQKPIYSPGRLRPLIGRLDQTGRSPALQAGGRAFKSRTVHFSFLMCQISIPILCGWIAIFSTPMMRATGPTGRSIDTLSAGRIDHLCSAHLWMIPIMDAAFICRLDSGQIISRLPLPHVSAEPSIPASGCRRMDRMSTPLRERFRLVVWPYLLPDLIVPRSVSTRFLLRLQEQRPERPPPITPATMTMSRIGNSSEAVSPLHLRALLWQRGRSGPGRSPRKPDSRRAVPPSTWNQRYDVAFPFWTTKSNVASLPSALVPLNTL